MKDISILGLMDGAFDSLQSAHELMNRYAALALDPDLGKSADPLQFIRENGDIWLKFRGDIYVDYPLLTESAFARNVCGGREFLHSSGIAMEAPFLKAIRFT